MRERATPRSSASARRNNEEKEGGETAEKERGRGSEGARERGSSLRPKSPHAVATPQGHKKLKTQDQDMPCPFCVMRS